MLWNRDNLLGAIWLREIRCSVARTEAPLSLCHLTMRTKHLLLTTATLIVGLLALPACDNNGDGDGGDLRQGAVFSMSNARSGNSIAAFSRDSDGMLTLVGRYDTGGNGSGSFEDTANGLILGNGQGESSPNNITDAADLLFATNAGSNSITVFKVNSDGLERVAMQPSGGEKPVSVTVNKGLLYVLHSGETNDDLFDAGGNVIAQNCTTGGLPSITGFRVSADGQLTPIPNSTRMLSGAAFSACAQVSFNPAGTVLVVTEREAAVLPGQTDNGNDPAGDEGVINTFVMNADGTPGDHKILDATDQGPFGFTFTKAGALLTTEQFDANDNPMGGAAASYTMNADGTLTSLGASVFNQGTDSCWFVATDNGQLGFVASFFNPTPRISSYRISPQGAITIINAAAAVTMEGTADLALSRDSQFLYNINSATGMVQAFRIGTDGSLTSIQSIQAHPPNMANGQNQVGVIGLAAS